MNDYKLDFHNETVNVLIVDDEENVREDSRHHALDAYRRINPASKKSSQSKLGLNIFEASNIEDMFHHLSNQQIHLLILDRMLENEAPNSEKYSKIDSFNHLQEIRTLRPNTSIVVLTSDLEITEGYQYARGAEVLHYIKKEMPSPKYFEQIQNCLIDAIMISKRNYNLREISSDSSCRGYSYKSKAMRLVERDLRIFASSNFPVLITGKPGSGKTHIAKRLHALTKEMNKQPKRLFINENILANQDSLARSTLFGSERGAYTGAHETKQGLFEIASTGDLFLDEIGDISRDIQGSLLKVIDEGTYKRVGGTREMTSTARLIFATNKDLPDLVAKGSMGQDFYDRIAFCTIHIPTLKERKEDIPYICQALLDDQTKNDSFSVEYKSLPEGLRLYLESGEIPGEVRGIRNLLGLLLLHAKQTEKNGSISFDGWRNYIKVPKVNLRKKETKQLTKTDIKTLIQQIADRVGTQEFTSMPDIKEQVEDALIDKAFSIYSTQKEVSKALGLSTSRINIIYKKKKNQSQESNK